MVSAVSLGQVGLILAYEASRLARNNADWYRLLDLAALVGALLADTDGVYDPCDYNDRLLLGLRGMLSEAELHLLQLRLQAGRQRQIAQGTYRQHLPTGLVRLPDGRVAKEPDLQIQRTIALVFERFARLGSGQQVLRSFREEGILLPRRQTAGRYAGELWWKRPSAAALYAILRNPAYAGAFVSGRTTTRPAYRSGQPGRYVRHPLAEWTALHHDVYPAYISWEQFMANQTRLADNASNFARRTRGAPRQGSALLAGLVVCGRCGHQMRVAYKARHRYFCTALTDTYRAPMCLSVDGSGIDAAVVEAFFAALQPAELDLLDELLATHQADHQRRLHHYSDQVKRAEYDARLAERQYQAVDPDNRLVAAELERRWELALRAVAEAREAAERFAVQAAPAATLDPALRAQVQDLGQHLPALWASGQLTRPQQKELVRSLVRRVIVSRPTPESVQVKVVWVSGAYSLLSVPAAVHRGRDLPDYEQFVARVVALSAEGVSDAVIAERLSREGFRSARSPTISAKAVERIRRLQGQEALRHEFCTRDHIDGHWTVRGLARHLGVSSAWLRRQITSGAVPAVRHAQTRCYLIADEPTILEQVRVHATARSLL